MAEADIAGGVNHLARLYGLRGLEVVIREGGGTSCALTDRGIRITFDPGEDGDSPAPPEAAALYAVARELGRASEAVKNPEFARAYRKKPRADKFFCDQIDFTAIDCANRAIPLIDQTIDAIYARLPHRLSGLPRDVQLLYAIRFSQVENDPSLEVDPEVEAALAELRNFQAGGLSFDVLRAIADPATRIQERRRLAEIFVRPLWQTLAATAPPGSGAPGTEQSPSQNEAADEPEAGERSEGLREESAGTAESEPQDRGEGGAETQGDSRSAEEAPSFSDALMDMLTEALEQEEERGALLPESRTSGPQAEPSAENSLRGAEDSLSFITGVCAETLSLSTGDARRYAESLDRLRPIIRQIAEVFLLLSAPQEALLSPRYARSASQEGRRFHPRAIQGAAIQCATRTPQAIWQRISKRARKQSLDFGGLDFFFFADVSGSMEGEKARCAADTALCLVEGLQFAAYLASRRNKQKPPDARLEIIAFGAGFDVIAPLSREPAAAQKGRAFVSLQNAGSKGTYIAAALNHARASLQDKDARRRLLFIISDGRFHDPEDALKAAASLPKSARIKQVFIGETGVILSDSFETVSSPADLPRKLFELLKQEIL